VEASRPDATVFNPHKYRAVAALYHAWTRPGEMMVIMVAAVWLDTFRSCFPFKLRAAAALDRAWPKFGGRILVVSLGGLGGITSGHDRGW